MQNRDSNRANMLRTTANFCADNTSATSAIPAFATALTDTQAQIKLLDQLNEIDIGTTKGVTLDTNTLRKTMTLLAVKCASATFAYADSKKNNTLKAKVNFTEQKLNAYRKEVVDDLCQNIRDAANANIANVQNWGATPSDVSDLQTAISIYRNATANPRNAIIKRSDAKRQIKTIIRQLIDVNLKSRMDKMVSTLTLTNPTFVNQYFLAREIIDVGTHHTRFTGIITATNKKLLASAEIILKKTGEQIIAYQTKPKANGKFSLNKISPAIYDLYIITLDTTLHTETNITLKPGKETKRRITL